MVAGVAAGASTLVGIAAVFTAGSLRAGNTGGGGMGVGATAGAGVASACMVPVPFISQASDTSGKASRIFCTTSRLGLLRSLRMWLITGRPTPIKSAN